MNFYTHQIEKGNAHATAKRQQNTANDYTFWCNAEGVEITESSYQNIMDFVAFLQQKGNKTRTIQQKLTTLRHFFEYLNVPNPALLVQLKGKQNTIPNVWLTLEELQAIYECWPTHGLVKKRDKVLLSLVIFQGVCSSELPKIEVSDLNLVQGTIYIPALRSTNSRTLELKAQQLLLFQDYIMNVRPLILQQASKQSEKLLVTTGQSPNLGNVIVPILKYVRCPYPKLKSFQQVRQSVVKEWVNQFGLRKAQYMAGHRFASSTERYNEDEMEGLKNALKNSHPLKK
jgi:site-specific recombinase XerD